MRSSRLLIGIQFASLAPAARADVTEGGGLLLLSAFILVPIALLYGFSRIVRAVVPAKHREFAGRLAIALPINLVLIKALRIFEPPMTQGKITFAILSIGALVVYVASYVVKKRRD